MARGAGRTPARFWAYIYKVIIIQNAGGVKEKARPPRPPPNKKLPLRAGRRGNVLSSLCGLFAAFPQALEQDAPHDEDKGQKGLGAQGLF